jgi:hypothetical protein
MPCCKCSSCITVSTDVIESAVEVYRRWLFEPDYRPPAYAEDEPRFYMVRDFFAFLEDPFASTFGIIFSFCVLRCGCGSYIDDRIY